MKSQGAGGMNRGMAQGSHETNEYYEQCLGGRLTGFSQVPTCWNLALEQHCRNLRDYINTIFDLLLEIKMKIY